LTLIDDVSARIAERAAARHDRLVGLLLRSGFDVPFTFEDSTIPVGIRCGACARRHLPDTIVPLAQQQLDDGRDVVLVRCPRCGSGGHLVIETPAEHRLGRIA
jgi:hypothetical protein